jgi:predicted DCC family thiol-disulfide oxidoreductase YuxK
METGPMIEVFYDGKCGLCSKEINYYRGIAPDGIFVWADIATNPEPLASYNIEQVEALRRLHARDTAGNWHVGVAAFILIWRQLRYWRLLAMLFSMPGVRQVADTFYNRFADYRFSRLAHCKSAETTNLGRKHLN